MPQSAVMSPRAAGRRSGLLGGWGGSRSRRRGRIFDAVECDEVVDDGSDGVVGDRVGEGFLHLRRGCLPLGAGRGRRLLEHVFGGVTRVAQRGGEGGAGERGIGEADVFDRERDREGARGERSERDERESDENGEKAWARSARRRFSWMAASLRSSP